MRNKVTPQRIKDSIRKEEFYILNDGRTTLCQLTLANGFTVTGESACVSIENFDKGIGEDIARNNAVDKVWQLEGYLLAEERYQDISNPFLKMDFIARVCHEVNRAYCQALGDNSQPKWEDAPPWQRESARMGVDLHLSGNFTPDASHVAWMVERSSKGWKYGPVKDQEKKEHPCMVPFDKLPKEQQVKDFIFRAVVHALRGK